MSTRRQQIIQEIIYLENRIFVLDGTVQRIINQFGENNLDDQFVDDLREAVYQQVSKRDQKLQKLIHEYDVLCE